MNPPNNGNAQGDVSLRLVMGILILALLPVFLWAQAPTWWTARGVIVSGSNITPNDYAAVNQGQLKNIATAAYKELNDNLPGGVGDMTTPELMPPDGGVGYRLTTLIGKWSNVPMSGTNPIVVNSSTITNDYAAVNIGQLKTVAKPFYDRLKEVGYTSQYPWTTSTNAANDYAMANIGQVKNLFSFDVTYDGDLPANGLPDWWEIKYFGNSGQKGNNDPDGDGLTNWQEYGQNSDPNDYFNGHPIELSLISGNNQEGTTNCFLPNPLTIRVSHSDRLPYVNAPVTFSVELGGGIIALSPQQPTVGETQIKITTDNNGMASVYYREPSIPGVESVIRISSGTNNVAVHTTTSYKPEPPEMLSASIQGDSVKLDWSASQRAESYCIKSSLLPQGPFASIGSISNETNSEVKGLASGLTYYFVITATNGSGESLNSPIATASIPISIPVVSLPGGRYATERHVLVSCSTSSVRIHYTYDGRDPAESDPSVESGETIGIYRTCTLKLRAFGVGFLPSAVVTERYKITGQVATAGNHSLVLRTDGEIQSFGDDASGMYNSISLSGVKAITSGALTNFALMEDGSLYVWGSSSSGALGLGLVTNTAPYKIDSIDKLIAISAGEDHVLALRNDGTVWAWGANAKGELGNGTTENRYVAQRVPGIDHIIAISAGKRHSVALKDDGTVWAWGANEYGQLGDGSKTDRLAPVQVKASDGAGELRGITQISAGDLHTIAYGETTLYSFGKNNNGQLCDHSQIDCSIPIATLFPGIAVISAGKERTFVLFEDGTLKSWGSNAWNGLGDSSVTSSFSITPVTVPGKWLAIGEGKTDHTMAIKEDDIWLWGWGRCDMGQLIANWAPSVTSTSASCLWMLINQSEWDDDNDGWVRGKELEMGTDPQNWDSNGNGISDSEDPDPVKYEYTFEVIGATQEAGEAGQTLSFNISVRLKKTTGESLPGTDVSFIPSMGILESMDGMLSDRESGELFVNTDNAGVAMCRLKLAEEPSKSVTVKAYANLGNTSVVIPIKTNRLSPPVFSFTGTTTVEKRLTLTAEPNCIIHYTTDGTQPTEESHFFKTGDSILVDRCMTINARAYRDGTEPSIIKSAAFRVTGDLAAGEKHTIALRSNGTVWTWGANDYGQLGDGSTTAHSSPVQVKNADGTGYLQNIVRVAAGRNTSYALDNRGAIYSWGDNTFGQLGNGPVPPKSIPTAIQGIEDVIEIAAGSEHAVALKKDGTVWTWGCNNFGQLGRNSSLRLEQYYQPFVKEVTNEAETYRAWLTIDAGPNFKTYTSEWTRLYKKIDVVPFWGNQTNVNYNPYCQWIKQSGPGDVSFNYTNEFTAAIFSAPGIYTLRLMTSDYKNVSAEDTDPLMDTVNVEVTSAMTNSVPQRMTPGIDDVYLENAIAIAAGEKHTVVMTCDPNPLSGGYGSIYGCGVNTAAQFNTFELYPEMCFGYVPIYYAINTDDYYMQFGTGLNQIFVAEIDRCVGGASTLAGGGDDQYNQLGGPVTNEYNGIYFIKSICPGESQKITGGMQHTCWLVGTGLYVTGRNNEGQIGLGSGTAQQNEFTALNGEWLNVAAGYYHTIVADIYGNVLSCGRNSSGQLGIGDLGQRSVPTLLYGFNLIYALSDDDGDGVLTWRERELGTAPGLADSDGDGINDKDDSAPLDYYNGKRPVISAAGDNQSGDANGVISSPLQVTLYDEYGRLLKNAPVTIESGSGGAISHTCDSGFANLISCVTDSNGKVQFYVQLPNLLNSGYKVTASAGSGSQKNIYTFNLRTNSTSGIPNSGQLIAGSVPSNFWVDQAGSARYDIPIEVPPGTNGLVPNLSFSYNSQQSNGLLGIGWTLNGIGIITRVPSTKEDDGIADVVNFNELDRFALNGERLIAVSGEYGRDGTIYRTKNNNFTKVVSIGQANGSPAYFKAWTKSGLILEFGKTSDSTISAGSPQPAMWALNRVEDRHGNAMSISYTANQTTGEWYPACIEYGSNSNVGTISHSKVIFAYESRLDNVTVLVGTTKLKTESRLSSVKTVIGNKTVKEYRLTYEYGNASNASRIANITSYDSDGNHFAPLSFTYGESTNQFFEDAIHLPPVNSSELVIGDFNGNGRLEFLMPTKSGSSQIYEIGVGKRNGPCIGGWDVVARTVLGTVCADFDGDGQSDLLSINGDVFYSHLAGAGLDKMSSDDQETWLYHNNEGFLSCQGPSLYVGSAMDWSAAAIADSNLRRVKTGDFNGDGKTDILRLDGSNSGNSTIYYSTGRGFRQAEGPSMYVKAIIPPAHYPFEETDAIGYDLARVVIADFNGDGKSDILRLDGNDSASSTLFLATNSGFTQVNGPSIYLRASSQDDLKRLKFVDIDGDGLTDIFILPQPASGSDETLVWHNIGNGDFVLENGPNIHIDDSDELNRIFFGDFNGDGYIDLLNLTKHASISFGTAVGAFRQTTQPCISEASGLAASGFLILDVDGDGKYDLVHVDAVMGNRLWRCSEAKPDKLVSVTDGFGSQISIEYEPLQNSSTYTREADAKYPILDMQPSRDVVSKYSWDDGAGGNQSRSYKYSGLKFDRDGNCSLGFHSISLTESSTGIQKTTSYRQDGLFAGVVDSVETRNSQNRLLDASKNSWTLNTQNSFIYLSHSENRSYDLDGILIKTEFAGYEVDHLGNRILAVLNTGNDCQTITEAKYLNDELNWIIGCPTWSRSTKQAPDVSAYQQVMSYERDPANGDIAYKYENSDSINRIVTHIEYDAFGNINEKTITAPDSPVAVSKYIYDPTGRFCVETTDSLNHTTQFGYDERFGIENWMRDPNHLEKSSVYDGFGRLVKTVDPQGVETNYIYSIVQNDANNAVMVITEKPSGGSATYRYQDKSQRTVRVERETPNGSAVKITEYDELGRSWRISDPYLNDSAVQWKYITYDLLSRPIQIIAPNGAITKTDYHGLRQIATDSNGHTLERRYNLQGQLIETIDAKGISVKYQYDATGNILTATNNSDINGYDEYGRKTNSINELSGRIEYHYNTLGQLIWHQDAKGNKVNYEYDLLGRCTKRSEPDGDTLWIYDTSANGIGKIASVSAPGGYGEYYTYDSFGRLKAKSVTVNGATYDTSFDYDAQGRMATRTLPGNVSVKYGYSTKGYLTELRDAVTNVLYWKALKWNAHGAISEYYLGNGVTTNVTQNGTTGLIEEMQSTAADLSIIQHLKYTWDSVGNLQSRADLRQGKSERFEYDELDRLEKVYLKPANSSAEALSTEVRYDSFGNIKFKTGVGDYIYGGSESSAKLLSISGAINSDFIYDANGNITSGLGRSITYTSFDQTKTLSQGSSSIEYRYSADHGRVMQILTSSSGTKTTIYLGPYERSETAASSSTTIEDRYFLNPDIVLTKTRENGVAQPDRTFYLHRDHLGLVNTITDEDGDVIERLSFDIFGKQRNSDWSGGLEQAGVSNNELQNEFGLVHMNGRIEDPLLSRFLVPDPLMNDMENLQAFNRYSYVTNNPGSYTDPSGYDPYYSGGGASIVNVYIEGCGEQGGVIVGEATGDTTGPGYYLNSVGGYTYSGVNFSELNANLNNISDGAAGNYDTVREFFNGYVKINTQNYGSNLFTGSAEIHLGYLSSNSKEMVVTYTKDNVSGSDVIFKADPKSKWKVAGATYGDGGVYYKAISKDGEHTVVISSAKPLVNTMSGVGSGRVDEKHEYEQARNKAEPIRPARPSTQDVAPVPAPVVQMPHVAPVVVVRNATASFGGDIAFNAINRMPNSAIGGGSVSSDATDGYSRPIHVDFSRLVKTAGDVSSSFLPQRDAAGIFDSPISCNGFPVQINHSAVPSDSGPQHHSAPNFNGLPTDSKTLPSDNGFAKALNMGADPVALGSGELIVENTDLSVPGRGFSFAFSRIYRNQIDYNGPLGYNWDFSYNCKLILPSADDPNQDIRYCNGSGRADTYTHNSDGTYTTPVGYYNELRKNPNSTFTIRDRHGFLIHFDSQGRMTMQVDRNGNYMDFQYDTAGRLSKIIDTMGRSYRVDYNDRGRIRSVTDFNNRSVVYTYDKHGDLVSVRSPIVVNTSTGNDFVDGKTTRYTYTSGFEDIENSNLKYLNHNLLTIKDGKGQTYLVNTYEEDPSSYEFDRIKTQSWGKSDQVITLDYSPMNGGASTDPNTAVAQTTLIDRNGNEHVYKHNRYGALLEYRAKANRKVNPDNPAEFVTTFTYNAYGEVLSKVMPEGDSTAFTYDFSNPDLLQRGNVLNVTRNPGPRGAAQASLTRTFGYEPVFNQVRSVTDERNHTTVMTFDYQEGNNMSALATAMRRSQSEVTALLSGAGVFLSVGDQNEDGATAGICGNVIKVKAPTVSLSGGGTQEIYTTYSYNRFGQVTSQIDPEGNVTDYQYYPESAPDGNGTNTLSDRNLASDTGGYRYATVADSRTSSRRTKASSPKQIRNEFSYDPAGNVVKSVDGRGNDTLYEVNALNQVVRIQSPAVGQSGRYETHVFYDANNNVVKRESRNVGTNGPDLGIYSTVQYAYDILDNVLSETVTASAAKSLTTTYGYDNNYNLNLIRQPLGNEIRVVYDERDLPFQITRGFGTADASTTTRTYDKNGNLKKLVDGNSKPTLYSYDGYDRLLETRDAVGNQSIASYDPTGNATSIQSYGVNGGPSPTSNAGSGNVLLAETKFAHDEVNRRYQIDRKLFSNTATAGQDGPLSAGDGYVSSLFAFDRSGRLVAATDDQLHTVSNEYDGANRLVKQTDPLQNEVSFGYDPNGNAETTTEIDRSVENHVPAETIVTHATFDALNRPETRTDNLGNVSKWTYDSRNNVTTITDPLVNVTTLTYDGINRLLSKTSDADLNSANPDGKIIERCYWDDNSRLRLVTDDNGHTTTYDYDALNRPWKTTYADTQAVINGYDFNGNATTITDQNGNVFTCGYDAINRLTSRSIARGAGVEGSTSQTVQYDGLSRLTLATTDNISSAADDSTVTYHYDSLSRPLAETETIGSNSNSVIRQFDSVGRRTTLTYPNGRIVESTSDDLNRFKTIKDQGDTSNIGAYDYLGASRVMERRYKNGTKLTLYSGNSDTSFDALRRLQRLTHVNGSAQTLAGNAYAYDKVGARRSNQNLFTGTGEVYSFDADYRLTRAAFGVSGASLAGLTNNAITNADVASLSGTSQTAYTLDGVENRAQRIKGDVTTNYAPDSMNAYATVGATPQTYDNNGNLKTNGSKKFYYDAFNRLVRVTTATDGAIASYAYDAFNRRIRKDVGGTVTAFYHDLAQTVEERNGTNTMLRQYVYGNGIDERLQLKSGGQNYYYHEDGQGSVVAITDSGGVVVERYGYSDFGETVIFNPDGVTVRNASIVGNAYGYTGREFDTETGIYYYRNRYYDPATGRFLSRDPIGCVDGLNLYSYCAGDPVNGSDPDGRCVKQAIRTVAPMVDGIENYGLGWLSGASRAADSVITFGIYGQSSGGTNLGQQADAIDSYRNQNLKLGYYSANDSTNVSRETEMALTAYTGAKGLAALAEAGPALWNGAKNLTSSVTNWFRGTSSVTNITTTVYRVEGLPNTRVIIGDGGQVSVQGDQMLFVNFGDKARAEQFLATRVQQGMPGAQMKSFQVTQSFVADLQQAAVPESMAKQFPGSPLLVDPTKAPNQFGLRPEQIKALQNSIIQGSGKVH